MCNYQFWNFLGKGFTSNICLNCGGSLKLHSKLLKFLFSLKHQVLLNLFRNKFKIGTMNMAIVFWSLMIVIFWSVATPMSIVAITWIDITNSLNFSCFWFFFATCDPNGLFELELPLIVGGSKLTNTLTIKINKCTLFSKGRSFQVSSFLHIFLKIDPSRLIF